MRTLILCLVLTACSHPTHHLTVLNSSFKETQARALGGQASIENSFVYDPTYQIVALHDPHADGTLVLSTLSPLTNTAVLANARFSYVLQHKDAYYAFVTRGDVFLYKSNDLRNWRLINDGTPVIPLGGIGWGQIWNVGVDVDDRGVWHLLAETNDGEPMQYGVGLSYATGVMTGDKLVFTKVEHHVVEGGGNPYLRWVPGKGLLVLHGQLDGDRVWYTTATTFDGVYWRRKSVWIGVPGVHVCDPHAIERYDGTTLLSVSVGQDSIYFLESEESLEGMF